MFVHPFDDPEVIAGQGTIGMEMLRQHSGPIGAIFVPDRRRRAGGRHRDVRQVPAAGDQGDRRRAGRRRQHEGGDRGRPSGRRSSRSACSPTASRCARSASRPSGSATTCSTKSSPSTTDEICAAIKDIFDDTRAIAEPAGALALAGLRKHVDDARSAAGPLIAINSGANINFDRLRHVAERAEIGEAPREPARRHHSREAGQLSRIRATAGRALGSPNSTIVTPMASRRRFSSASSSRGATPRKSDDRRGLQERPCRRRHERQRNGQAACPLHGRWPVDRLRDELVYRFQFPERPGALFKFLEGLRADWNISLFHYRNHGADNGRGPWPALRSHRPTAPCSCASSMNLVILARTKTQNPAYQLFLDSDGG